MNRRARTSVGIFVLTAYGAAWALLTPALLSGSKLTPSALDPAAFAATVMMMFTPASAAALVAVVREGLRWKDLRSALGLTRPFTRSAWRAALWSSFGAMGLVVGSWLLGILLGWAELDPERSVAKDVIIAITGQEPPLPMALLAVLQLVNLPIGLAITCVAVAGEEIGWRGWLLPRLLPMGTTPALLLSGAVWGGWHMPAILLGLNYSRPDVIGVGLMVLACTALGTTLGWLRLRNGSLLPCILAHATINVVATYQALLFPPFDEVLTGPLSVTGLALLIAAICGVRFVRRAMAPRRLERETTDR